MRRIRGRGIAWNIFFERQSGSLRSGTDVLAPRDRHRHPHVMFCQTGRKTRDLGLASVPRSHHFLHSALRSQAVGCVLIGGTPPLGVVQRGHQPPPFRRKRWRASCGMQRFTSTHLLSILFCLSLLSAACEELWTSTRRCWRWCSGSRQKKNSLAGARIFETRVSSVGVPRFWRFREAKRKRHTRSPTFCSHAGRRPGARA